eukprot:Mrub_07529.p3 GENE.Mrub_07529~~Mrub_07529.p3  ORF type:complete len:113 (-),score=2.87 Mrub_07529:511-849(-)
MISAFLVFFIYAGFAMLEMRSVRSNYAVNILIKNLLDLSLATMFWFIISYGITYCDKYDSFLGISYYAGSIVSDYGRDWLFQCAFAGTTATIESGSCRNSASSAAKWYSTSC